MSITLALLLYIYLGILFVYGIFALFNFYHLFKFGLNKKMAYFSAIIYISVVIGILGVSFYFISKIDWSKEYEIMQSTNNFINPPYAK